MTLVLFLSRGTKITPHHSSLLHPVMEILGDGIQEEVDHPAFSGVDIDPQCHAQAHTAVTPFNSTTSTGNIPCGQARGFAAPPETTATRTPCPFVACAPETRDAQNACHRRDLLQRTRRPRCGANAVAPIPVGAARFNVLRCTTRPPPVWHHRPPFRPFRSRRG